MFADKQSRAIMDAKVKELWAEHNRVDAELKLRKREATTMASQQGKFER